MLQLYNDLTHQVEPFVPRNAAASLYVCGITPYDTTHLGHAFTYCSFDILVRYLEWQGIAIRYVQNVTDIDDDILRKAREVKEDWFSLGNRWVRRFIADMEALNVRPPDAFPRATEVIPEIIRMVQMLVERGCAYARGGSVYYRSALARFGGLSRLPLSEWLRVAGERGNIAEDPNKESPLDFVLWQAQAPGEPAWLSPWGPGRPGWHIECSTITNLFLGPTIDIHGGGADLAFPHHECEIAQAESCTASHPLARYWLHTGMVYYQGEKMSKSLGNLVMVCDLLENFTSDALRLYLGSHRYRETWAYDPARLQQAEAMAHAWQVASGAPDNAASPRQMQEARTQFQAAMDDDLDTPRAIQALDRLARAILVGRRGPGAGVEAQRMLQELAAILGLRLNRAGPEPRVTAGWETHKARFWVVEARLV